MVSNKRVNRIGNKLSSEDDYREELDCGTLKDLLEWSLSFSSPVYSLMSQLKILPEIQEGAILSSLRIKCLETICSKAHKLGQGCQLSTLDDIAGIRFIVRDMNHLNLISEALKIYFLKQQIKFHVKDYISGIRNTGYHAIHFLIKDSVMVEIQLRTEYEHIWTQAIETIDRIRGLDFKHCSLDGFFRTAGEYIFSKEIGEPNYALQKKAIELDKAKGYTDDLQMFYSSVSDLSYKENADAGGWFVIIPIVGQQSYLADVFKELEEAKKCYRNKAIMKPGTLLVYTDFPDNLSELYVARNPASFNIAESFRQLIYDSEENLQIQPLRLDMFQ